MSEIYCVDNCSKDVCDIKGLQESWDGLKGEIVNVKDDRGVFGEGIVIECSKDEMKVRVKGKEEVILKDEWKVRIDKEFYENYLEERNKFGTNDEFGVPFWQASPFLYMSAIV